MSSRTLAFLLTLAVAGAATADEDLAKRLQNPVADLISLPFQWNWDGRIGPRDASRFTLNVQPVIPVNPSEDWHLIARTILPIIQQQSPARGVDAAFGVGDTVQSFFLSPVEPLDGWILGGGPVFLVPTGTSPELRSEQLGVGPTAVLLRQQSGWTWGALLNPLWGVTDRHFPK